MDEICPVGSHSSVEIMQKFSLLIKIQCYEHLVVILFVDIGSLKCLHSCMDSDSDTAYSA